MTLGQKQRLFLYLITRLIRWTFLRLGYELTAGDFYRADSCSHGHPRSLHRQRLAADLNLFINGKYQRTTEAHRQLGRFWKSLSGYYAPGEYKRVSRFTPGAVYIECVWGGDFSNPDGNHYALEHQGMR